MIQCLHLCFESCSERLPKASDPVIRRRARTANLTFIYMMAINKEWEFESDLVDRT